MKIVRLSLLALALTSIPTPFPLPLATAELRASPATSKVSFVVRGSMISLQGVFTRYKGAMEISPEAPAPSKLHFTLDLSKVTLQGGDERASLLAEQIIESFPDTIVSFRTVRVKLVSDSKLLLVGEASWNGRREVMTIPVDVLERTAERTVVGGSLSGNPDFTGPVALLLGDAEGSVHFTLAFATSNDKKSSLHSSNRFQDEGTHLR